MGKWVHQVLFIQLLFWQSAVAGHNTKTPGSISRRRVFSFYHICLYVSLLCFFRLLEQPDLMQMIQQLLVMVGLLLDGKNQLTELV